MIMGIAALVFVPLLAGAIALFIWALGGTWPLKDEQLLAGAITGRSGKSGLPPRWAFLMAAIALLASGILVLSLADPEAGGTWLNALGVGAGAVFAARGIAGFTTRWRTAFSAEPFATLDRKTYSPLALLIGAGFLVLVLLRLT